MAAGARPVEAHGPNLGSSFLRLHRSLHIRIGLAPVAGRRRGLNIDGFSDRRKKQFAARSLCRTPRRIVVQLDRRKGVVMNANELPDPNELGGPESVIDSHGKEIANWEDSETQLGDF